MGRSEMVADGGAFLGNGAQGITYALAIDTGGKLYAGGWLLGAGTAGDNFLAWDGERWGGCAGGTDDNVTALASDNSGNIFLGGDFAFVESGYLRAYRLAKFNLMTLWQSLDSTPSNRQSVLAISANDAGDIIAGGVDRSTELSGGYSYRPYIISCRHPGWPWDDLAATINIYSIAIDNKKNVYVAGSMKSIGGTLVNNVAKCDGTKWYGLGAGIHGGYNGIRDFNGVLSVACSPSGIVYACGFFDSAGSVAARNIASWDGTTWSALGAGLCVCAGNPNFDADAMAIDSSGNLYAGGRFDSAGNVAARSIAKWDGNAWSPLGPGVSGTICAVAYRKQDKSVYVAGYFDTIGMTVIHNIARWDGASWHPLSSGLSGKFGTTVSALSIDSAGNVYAGGYIDTNTSSMVKMWNGSEWRDVCGCFTSSSSISISSLIALNENEIYIGGEIWDIKGTKIRNVAKWDGMNWSGFGSGAGGGVHNTIRSMALSDSFLFVGGAFDSAGGKVSPGLAKVNVKDTTRLAVLCQHRNPDQVCRFRFEHKKMILGNSAPSDRVYIFTLDGRLAGRYKGTSVIDLKRLTSGAVIYRIERIGKSASTGIAILE